MSMLSQRYGRQCAEARQRADVFHVFCGKRQKRKDTALHFRPFRRLGSGKPRSKNKEKQPAPLAGGKPTFRLIIWNFDLIYQIQPTQITCLQVCLQYAVTCKCLFLSVLLYLQMSRCKYKDYIRNGQIIRRQIRRPPLMQYSSCKKTATVCILQKYRKPLPNHGTARHYSASSHYTAFKTPQTAFQKATFCNAKCRLSRCERRHFRL